MKYPLIPNTDINYILTSALSNVIAFLPKLIVALIIFFLGKILAKSLSKLIIKLFPGKNLAKFVNSFQLGAELKEESAAGFIQIVALIIRYAVLYATLILSFQIIGLTGIASFMAGLVGILPKLLSATIILLIGILIAGFVETLIKKALVSFDPATARLGGKIASYTVVSFFALIGLAELGLASTFINTLFIGLVAAVSLACGLAFGLGAKDLVKDILANWYKQRKAKK